MPSVDIVTAAGPGSERFLREATASVASLEHVPGWDVRWLVTADGPSFEENIGRAQLAAELGAAIHLANPERCWAGVSRNRALIHARGDYVVTLDADDVLMPGALRAWAQASEVSPAWSAFPVSDWHPDGSIENFPDAFVEGLVPAGAWLVHFEAHGAHPAHPISVLWPRQMLVAVGGWSGVPFAEDAQPCLVLTSRYDGWWSRTPTHLYRRHPDQITESVTREHLNAVASDARAFACEQARVWARSW